MAMDTLSFKNSSGTVVTTGVHNDEDGNVQTTVSLDGSIATYAASGSAFAQVANPTVWLVVQGSASKTVRIRRIELSGAATAAGSMPVIVARCSAAGTLGSAVLTGVTAGKHDTQNDAATAVVSTVGTANYGTPPTVVANLAAGRVSMTALGAAAQGGNPGVVLGGELGEQGIVLRGTSDFLTVSASGAAVPSGGVNDYRIVWTEETE